MVTSKKTQSVKLTLYFWKDPVQMIDLSTGRRSFFGFLTITIEWSLISKNGKRFVKSDIEGKLTVLTPLLFRTFT